MPPKKANLTIVPRGGPSNQPGVVSGGDGEPVNGAMVVYKPSSADTLKQRLQQITLHEAGLSVQQKVSGIVDAIYDSEVLHQAEASTYSTAVVDALSGTTCTSTS